jgi:phage gp46-like protein
MIQLDYQGPIDGADIVMDGDQIESSEVLNTAVAISLFTRRLASTDDVLPEPRSHREGWWADDYATNEGDHIGSRLWLLNRSTLSQSTLNAARVYCLEALQWLIDDGVAASIEVDVSRYAGAGRQDTLFIEVRIFRPTTPASRWAGTWQAHLEEL